MQSEALTLFEVAIFGMGTGESWFLKALGIGFKLQGQTLLDPTLLVPKDSCVRWGELRREPVERGAVIYVQLLINK